MDLMTFYSNNIDKLDSKWRSFCIAHFKGREIGDKYHDHNAFWQFVEMEYKTHGRLRERTA